MYFQLKSWKVNVSLPMARQVKTFMNSVAVDGLAFYCGRFAYCFCLFVKCEYLFRTQVAMAGLLQQWYFHLTSYIGCISLLQQLFL